MVQAAICQSISCVHKQRTLQQPHHNHALKFDIGRLLKLAEYPEGGLSSESDLVDLSCVLEECTRLCLIW